MAGRRALGDFRARVWRGCFGFPPTGCRERGVFYTQGGFGLPNEGVTGPPGGPRVFRDLGLGQLGPFLVPGGTPSWGSWGGKNRREKPGRGLGGERGTLCPGQTRAGGPVCPGPWIPGLGPGPFCGAEIPGLGPLSPKGASWGRPPLVFNLGAWPKGLSVWSATDPFWGGLFEKEMRPLFPRGGRRFSPSGAGSPRV